MDYRVKLNTQEDENAPRGTMYYVEFEKLDDWNTLMAGSQGYSWEEAMARAIEKLQELGEI